jgi:hypothetical protein
VTIRTTAIKWDGARRYIYTVTAGKVVGEGPNVEWDLTGVAPGKYTITVAINILYGDRWALVGKSVTKEVMVR